MPPSFIPLFNLLSFEIIKVRDFIQIGRLETGLPQVEVTEKVGGYKLVWSGVLFVTFA